MWVGVRFTAEELHSLWYQSCCSLDVIVLVTVAIFLLLADAYQLLWWLKTLFYKTSNRNTAQMALFLVFNENATAKIALCTYLKPTLNENFVGWA